MRRAASTTVKWLLFLSASILAAGSILHLVAYTKASATIEHSSLPPFYQAALKGLWLSEALSSLLLAVAFASIGAQPKLARNPLLLLLAFVPLGMAAILFSTMGNFFASYLNLSAAAAALLAVVLRATVGTNIK